MTSSLSLSLSLSLRQHTLNTVLGYFFSLDKSGAQTVPKFWGVGVCVRVWGRVEAVYKAKGIVCLKKISCVIPTRTIMQDLVKSLARFLSVCYISCKILA